MKKLTVFLLTLLLLVGCGTQPATPIVPLPTTPSVEEPPAEPAPAPLQKPGYTVAPELVPTERYSLERYPMQDGLWLMGQLVRSGSNLYFRAEAGEGELIPGIYTANVHTGGMRLLRNYPTPPPNEDGSVTRTAPEGLFPGEEGTVWLLETTTTLGEEKSTVRTLRNLAADGTEKTRFEVPVAMQLFCGGAVEGDRLLLADLEQLLLFRISEGKALAALPTAQFPLCAFADDGGLAVLCQDEKGMATIQRLEGEMPTLLAPTALNLPVFALDSFETYPGNGDVAACGSEVTFACKGNPFSLNTKTGKVQKLAEWIHYGINPIYIGGQTVGEDGVVAALYRPDSTSGKAELLILTPDNSAPVEEVLTLGVLYASTDTVDTVIAYNEQNPARRVRLVNYAEYPVFGQNAQIMLRTDIAAGRGPDLIASPERDTPVTELAAGYLEDLYPFVKGDVQLQEEGLIQSVLKVQEKSGKLLSLSPAFTLSTAVSTKTLAGTGTLSVSRAANLYQQLSTEDSSAQEAFSRQEAVMEKHIFRNSLLYGVAESDTFDFNNHTFQEGITYAALFPAEIDWAKYDTQGEDAGWMRVRSGRQLLLSGDYYGFSTLSRDLYAVGDGAVLCGFPDVAGGHVLELWDTYGLVSASLNKDAAWDFLRCFLLAEHQTKSQALGFPTNLAAFYAKGMEAMKQEGTITLHSGETSLEVPAQLSQSQYNEILAAVEKASARYHSDYEVFAAVWPQVKACLEGKQDLSVTAAAAQTAAKNYHNPDYHAQLANP